MGKEETKKRRSTTRRKMKVGRRGGGCDLAFGRIAIIQSHTSWKGTARYLKAKNECKPSNIKDG